MVRVLLFSFIIMHGAGLYAITSNTHDHHHHGIEGGEQLGKHVVRPQTVESNFKSSSHMQTRLDSLSGAVRFISIASTISPTVRTHALNSYQEVMHSFVREHVVMLGVDVSDLRLNDTSTLITDDVAFFKYDVYRDGIQIEDASLLFRFKQGRLLQVVNYSFAEASDGYGRQALLSDRELKHMLVGAFGEIEASHSGKFYRINGVGNGYELQLVKQFNVKRGDATYIVQVNAHTGEIYEVMPSKYHARGVARAEVYPRYYGDAPSINPLSGLFIDTDTVENRLDKEWFIITNKQGEFNVSDSQLPSIKKLNGLKVRINNRTGDNAVSGESELVNGAYQLVVKSSTDTLASNNKIAAQTSVYYHLDKLINVVSKYINPFWMQLPMVANTNLEQTCNAHYDTLMSTVNFYSGSERCANTGLIADVIYHEWGHALDAKTGGITDGAFSEGFGDIVSMLMTGSNIIGKGFFLENDEPIRDLAPDRVYPRDFANERRTIHTDGLIIGSTFWDLFESFKGAYTEEKAFDLVRNYAFKMVYSVERFTDVYDVLLILDDDDVNLENLTPNFCMINKNFADHGLATHSSDCS
ncbi:MAG: hypothetical protein OYH77_03115 [Pseudomonadota bacterium]|nr:hypothetical protein [Pseudomonadota bacterium]